MVPERVVWRKSSWSGNSGGECVEVGRAAEWRGVRDSKNPAGPVLVFGAAGLSAFVAAVKLGVFEG
ncbi:MULTISPECIES: DUF397 domain-containing protein [Actinosynnema]|uniref:DUF397 domain-containing protein n=1 Tax=Actinosynnema TaxID=40566 RepID=UPI0027E22AE0|nr:DUF397 domain-containing protein [Actinosynnema pretiosum]MCP2093545.1 protein of unknown function (DUF397) [Actinosynnema pretiosum]